MDIGRSRVKTLLDAQRLIVGDRLGQFVLELFLRQDIYGSVTDDLPLAVEFLSDFRR
jgi:hypothetical protein